MGVLLTTIATNLIAIKKAIRDAARDEQSAGEARRSVATERWETLCTSLERLEGATKKNRPPSHVGEDFEPDPDPNPFVPLTQSLKVKCAKCGKTVKAKSDWAGRSGKCPGCGSSIQFPATAAFDDPV